MPRKPKGTKPIAKTSARMSRKAALTSAQLEKIDAYWRASNYLTACQLYLLDNPLLKEPLQPEHIKKKIVGHWGTCPGQNFIYTHLNRVIVKDDLNMIYLSGPGHGGNAMVAHTYMEGTYSEVFGAEPQYKYIIVSTKSYVEKKDIENLASTFLKEDIVTGASTASDMAGSVDVSIGRILSVVMLFVVSACLLAMIVMYTNSNVNLSERTREIANIKVIGLSDHEVLIYVIRENIISTVLGAVIGLIAGIFLHSVLMGFISVDNIVYGSSISWWSYLVTIAIIVLISLISALPIRFKIDRIDMAQTLKEIE